MTRRKRPTSLIDGAALMARLDALARFTETPGMVTRTYLTPAHQAAGRQLIDWMAEAGMTAGFDAVGNVVGRLEGTDTHAPAIVLGSHYDSVINAGRYDGPYGILAAIAAVDALRRDSQRQRAPVEVVAFAEEEGVRFKATLIGSRAFAGTLDPAVLDLRDGAGVRLGDELAAFHGSAMPPLSSAARKPGSIACYIEAHIEQGPVLLRNGEPLGIVTGIAGASRFAITVAGEAGHAGTVPMAMRRDALAATAEMVLAVERMCTGRPDLVGTVGMLEVPGGATNVVPGKVRMTLDVRSGEDAVRRAAIAAIQEEFDVVARRRDVALGWTKTHDAAAVACDPALQAALAASIGDLGLPVRHMASGAGHDAMALASVCPVAMLFVRCGNGGISHDPRETMTAADAALGAEVLYRTVRRLADAPAPRGRKIRVARGAPSP
jgi:hydantoinase/carbamoylase family amidase